MKLAGGLSETKASCPLPISAFSIVLDFIVLLASWSGAEVTPTHALNTSSIYCFGVFVRFTQSKAPRQIQIYSVNSSSGRIWYPIFSHSPISSSNISALVSDVLWSSTTAPGWMRPSSLSKASSFVGWLSSYQST